MAVQALRHYRATEWEINRKIDELLTIKQELLDVIRTTPGQQSQELLKRRYLCRETWEEIAEHLHLSLQETVRLHKKVLTESVCRRNKSKRECVKAKNKSLHQGVRKIFEESIAQYQAEVAAVQCPSRGVQRGRRIHYAAAPNTQ